MTSCPFVSTGRLPDGEAVRALIAEAHQLFRAETAGEVSAVYPALSRVPPDLFGICLASTEGELYEAGDDRHEFTIMSVAKPFVFALICEAFGADEAWRRIGVNATGRPFNSLEAIERGADGRTNPMVNAGAIVTASLAPGDSPEARWDFVREGLSRFCGRTLHLHEEVFASASATNHRNRGIAQLLTSLGALALDPDEAVDLYTRQSSLSVTARDLAVMGATLADGGIHPISRARVVGADSARRALAVMATAGMYETSGDWLYQVGLPGKSGIGGGIVTVSPGKGGLGTFAPRLDAAGNSVRGQRVAHFLADRLGLDLFLSAPRPR